MSLRRERYIHRIIFGCGGFTAQIAPNYADENETCRFRITFCNPKEQFSRKLGREYLEEKEFRVVRVVDLSKLLAEAEARVYGDSVPSVGRFEVNLWTWVYKYFL